MTATPYVSTEAHAQLGKHAQRVERERFLELQMDQARENPWIKLVGKDTTVGRLTPTRFATTWFCALAARASTIRDRSASACAVFGRRALHFNVSRSSSLKTSGGIGRPVLIGPLIREAARYPGPMPYQGTLVTGN